MPRANEIKKGMVLNYNGKLLLVKDIDIQSPTARGAATLYNCLLYTSDAADE